MPDPTHSSRESNDEAFELERQVPPPGDPVVQLESACIQAPGGLDIASEFTPIECLGLKTRAYNALKNHALDFIEEVVQCSERGLTLISNFHERSLEALRMSLAARGMDFSPNPVRLSDELIDEIFAEGGVYKNTTRRPYLIILGGLDDAPKTFGFLSLESAVRSFRAIPPYYRPFSSIWGPNGRESARLTPETTTGESSDNAG